MIDNLLDMNTSSLNISFQLPQNICMGLAEIFATVASLEFAYLAAPRSAQTLFMSLQFCSLGISSFIGNGYFSIYSTKSNFDFSVSRKNTFNEILICIFLVFEFQSMDLFSLFFYSCFYSINVYDDNYFM